MFSSFLSKGKKLVDKVNQSQSSKPTNNQYDSGEDDDLVEIKHTNN